MSQTISIRDPRLVSFFKPYEDGDHVTLGDKTWEVKQGMQGWYLTDTGDYKGAHPVISRVLGMIDLIHLIENQFFRMQLATA